MVGVSFKERFVVCLPVYPPKNWENYAIWIYAGSPRPNKEWSLGWCMYWIPDPTNPKSLVFGLPGYSIIQRENAGTLGWYPSYLSPPRSPLKGDIPSKYPLYKVYMGLIIKGTIPRVPPFSLWIMCWNGIKSPIRFQVPHNLKLWEGFGLGPLHKCHPFLP